MSLRKTSYYLPFFTSLLMIFSGGILVPLICWGFKRLHRRAGYCWTYENFATIRRWSADKGVYRSPKPKCINSRWIMLYLPVIVISSIARWARLANTSPTMPVTVPSSFTIPHSWSAGTSTRYLRRGTDVECSAELESVISHAVYSCCGYPKTLKSQES